MIGTQLKVASAPIHRVTSTSTPVSCSLFNRLPAAWMDALPVLTLDSSKRASVLTALTSAGPRSPGVVFALLVAGYSVVAWAQVCTKASRARRGRRCRQTLPPPAAPQTRTKEYALQPADALQVMQRVRGCILLATPLSPRFFLTQIMSFVQCSAALRHNDTWTPM